MTLCTTSYGCRSSPGLWLLLPPGYLPWGNMQGASILHMVCCFTAVALMDYVALAPPCAESFCCQGCRHILQSLLAMGSPRCCSLIRRLRRRHAAPDVRRWSWSPSGVAVTPSALRALRCSLACAASRIRADSDAGISGHNWLVLLCRPGWVKVDRPAFVGSAASY